MTRHTAFPQPNRYTIRVRLPAVAPRASPADTATMATAPVGTLLESRMAVSATHSQHSHHNRDLALQKYMLLQEQHESLRQHLDELRPLQTSLGSAASTTTSCATSPTGASIGASGPAGIQSSSPNSMSLSPTLPHQRHCTPASRPYRRTSVPSEFLWGLETVPDETMLAEVAVEEAKLCDVNEGIKRTLTELLNCSTVRGDRAFRTWVQSRLMDTERELRSGRRRRSAPEP